MRKGNMLFWVWWEV